MSTTYLLGRSRRSFLKTGAAGLALVGAGGWLAAHLTDRGARAVLERAEQLSVPVQAMLAQLADAVLDGMLPLDAADRRRAIVGVVATADRSIAALPPQIRKETQDLFAMLGAAPTRALLIGQWIGWADASRADVAAMLGGLRDSSVGLRRAVYIGLRDLVASCYYADPASWAQLGYPGPLLRGPGAEV